MTTLRQTCIFNSTYVILYLENAAPNSVFETNGLGTIRSSPNKVDSLRDVSLFLGDNHSTFVITFDFIECHLNSILFCDDYFDLYYLHRRPIDIGLCDLNDGSITRHYSLKHSLRYPKKGLWHMEDIICCSNEIVYALDNVGVLLSIDVSGNLNKIKCITLPDTDNLNRGINHQPYLVESPNGDIL